MELNYCRRCGAKLMHQDNNLMKCENDHSIYLNHTPTVGVFFVTDEDHVLLSERGIEPHKGMLDSFGGFVDAEETFEQAAIRELKEELELQPSEYEPLTFLCSGVGHYPYEDEILPILCVFFWTRLTTDRQLEAHDDVAAIRSLPLSNIDPSLLHDDDIRTGIKALQELFIR